MEIPRIGASICPLNSVTGVCPLCGRQAKMQLYRMENDLRLNLIRFPRFHKKTVCICSQCAGTFPVPDQNSRSAQRRG